MLLLLMSVLSLLGIVLIVLSRFVVCSVVVMCLWLGVWLYVMLFVIVLLNSMIFWFIIVIWLCRLCSWYLGNVILLMRIFLDVGLKKCGIRLISVVLLLFDGFVSVIILLGVMLNDMWLSVGLLVLVWYVNDMLLKWIWLVVCLSGLLLFLGLCGLLIRLKISLVVVILCCSGWFMFIRCLSGEMMSSIVVMNVIKLLIVVWLFVDCMMVIVSMMVSVIDVRNCVSGCVSLFDMIICIE